MSRLSYRTREVLLNLGVFCLVLGCIGVIAYCNVKLRDIERAKLVEALRQPSLATPARLIGECNGQLFAAMEEDQFPSGCAWIEPIHYQSANGETK